MQFNIATIFTVLSAVAGLASAYADYDHLYARDAAHLEAREAAADAYAEAFEEALYRRGGGLSKLTSNCNYNNDCKAGKEKCVIDKHGNGKCKPL